MKISPPWSRTVCTQPCRRTVCPTCAARTSPHIMVRFIQCPTSKHNGMDSLALYIHFPFCLSICPYCDFDRQATGFGRIDVYLDCVKREVEQYAGRGERVHSIFFGGGTPSLMSADQLERLIA